jgi:nucleotide-binding universal stress UspA family protein
MSTGRATVTDDLTSPVVEFSRILAATDFSDGARAALDCALAIAHSFQSKVYLAHVIPTQLLSYVSPEWSAETVANAELYGAHELERLAASVDWAGVAHETLLMQGPIWPVLRETIQTNQIDLIALGTHGKASNQKFILGSVAEKIFRMAEIPTLTAAPRMSLADDAKTEFQRLLFATNFKPHAERAASVAYLLERRLNAQIAALHVVEESSSLIGESQEIVRDFIVKRMRRGVPQALLQNCEAEFLVRFGEPAAEILGAATQANSDLIIVGLRASKKSAGLLPSPTAYKLVCQSPCPVLTHRK